LSVVLIKELRKKFVVSVKEVENEMPWSKYVVVVAAVADANVELLRTWSSSFVLKAGLMG